MIHESVSLQKITLEKTGPAAERRGNYLKGFKDFYLKAKARTVLNVPYSLDVALPGNIHRHGGVPTPW